MSRRDDPARAEVGTQRSAVTEWTEGGEVRSVYLHAPFCVRRCFYCDFAVTVQRAVAPGPWLGALGSELAALDEEGRMRLADLLDTVYVGGGTPSLLGPTAMKGVADLLGPHRLTADSLEWTAEANPESFTREVADGWRSAGLNRLSLGTQSFQEGVLRWMGRLHGASGSEEAVRTARAAGILDLSVDLIFGLPASVPRDWGRDLDRVLALDVPHLSLYGLTAEVGTPLGRAVTEGRLQLAEESRYEDEYLEACERLVGAGYEHYEVSNFARPGHRSRHNGVYWSGDPYLGLGNSSHSYFPPVRRWNERDWATYAALARDGRVPVGGCEKVVGGSRRLEEIWLGLRTDRGLRVEWPSASAPDVLVAGWCARGLARIEQDRLLLSAQGWLLLDRLTVELDGALAPSGG